MVERMASLKISKLLRRDERGQSVVETAIVVSLVLLPLLAVVWDFGRVFHDYIVISNASREGARYASHFPDYDIGIKDKTKQEAGESGVTLADDNIKIDRVNGVSGEPITVTVAYGFSTRMSSIWGGENITLTASTAMIIFGLDE